MSDMGAQSSHSIGLPRMSASGPILLKNSKSAGLTLIFGNNDSICPDCANHCCAEHFIQSQMLLTKNGEGVFQQNRAVCRQSASKSKVMKADIMTAGIAASPQRRRDYLPQQPSRITRAEKIPRVACRNTSGRHQPARIRGQDGVMRQVTGANPSWWKLRLIEVHFRDHDSEVRK